MDIIPWWENAKRSPPLEHGCEWEGCRLRAGCWEGWSPPGPVPAVTLSLLIKLLHLSPLWKAELDSAVFFCFFQHFLSLWAHMHIFKNSTLLWLLHTCHFYVNLISCQGCSSSTPPLPPGLSIIGNKTEATKTLQNTKAVFIPLQEIRENQ